MSDVKSQQVWYLNRLQRLFWFLILKTFFIMPQVFSQPKTSNKPVFISVGSYYGAFQVHTDKLTTYKGVNPYGIEIEVGQLILTDKVLQSFGIYPKWGFGMSYVNFGHPDLGYTISALSYVEPFFKVSGRLRFSAKAAMGVAYMSSPYELDNNPNNLTYSTHIAFPLIAGINMYHFFNDQWAIKGSASFRHISNGGIKEPNLGINYAVFAFGLEYTPDVYQIPQERALNPFSKQKRTEILMSYSQKNDTGSVNSRNVFFATINRSIGVGRINALNFGTMVEYQQLFDFNKAIDQWSIAPLIGNEFLIGRFRFGQQLGIYLLQGRKAPNYLLQQYYLRYLFKKYFTTGINLKVHGRVADHLSIQLGYVF